MELYGRSGVKNGSRQNLNAGWAPETGFEGGFYFVAFEFEFQFPVVRFLVCIMFFFLGFLDSVYGGFLMIFLSFFWALQNQRVGWGYGVEKRIRKGLGRRIVSTTCALVPVGTVLSVGIIILAILLP